jgi:hypothetical protein
MFLVLQLVLLFQSRIALSIGEDASAYPYAFDADHLLIIYLIQRKQWLCMCFYFLSSFECLKFVPQCALRHMGRAPAQQQATPCTRICRGLDDRRYYRGADVVLSDPRPLGIRQVCSLPIQTH